MTGTTFSYSSVLRNVANIATIILSVKTTHVKTFARVKTLKHPSPKVKREGLSTRKIPRTPPKFYSKIPKISQNFKKL